MAAIIRRAARHGTRPRLKHWRTAAAVRKLTPPTTALLGRLAAVPPGGSVRLCDLAAFALDAAADGTGSGAAADPLDVVPALVSLAGHYRTLHRRLGALRALGLARRGGRGRTDEARWVCTPLGRAAAEALQAGTAFPGQRPPKRRKVRPPQPDRAANPVGRRPAVPPAVAHAVRAVLFAAISTGGVTVEDVAAAVRADVAVVAEAVAALVRDGDAVDGGGDKRWRLA